MIWEECFFSLLHTRETITTRAGALHSLVAHLDDADLEGPFLGELGKVLLEEIAGHVRLGEGEGAAEKEREGEEKEGGRDVSDVSSGDRIDNASRITTVEKGGVS